MCDRDAFHPFLRLPTEIRRAIWTAAIPHPEDDEPVMVAIPSLWIQKSYWTNEVDGNDTQGISAKPLRLVSWPIPVVRNVCREARNITDQVVAARGITLHRIKKSRRAKYTSGGEPPDIPPLGPLLMAREWQPEKDFIYVGMLDVEHVAQAATNPNNSLHVAWSVLASKVCNLAVDLHDMRCYPTLLMILLQYPFEGLSAVHLVDGTAPRTCMGDWLQAKINRWGRTPNTVPCNQSDWEKRDGKQPNGFVEVQRRYEFKQDNEVMASLDDEVIESTITDDHRRQNDQERYDDILSLRSALTQANFPRDMYHPETGELRLELRILQLTEQRKGIF